MLLKWLLYFLWNLWNSKFRVKIKFRVLHDIAISQAKLKIFISGNENILIICSEHLYLSEIKQWLRTSR